MNETPARPNLSDDLCATLRRRIADTDIAPGTRINEVHLARTLTVSRTPLREALTRLASEGLVDNRPRRGFFVRALSLGEFRELYPLRAHLDPLALRQGGLPDAGRLAALRRLNARIAAASGDAARVIDLDDRWHRLLIDACPNALLKQFIDQLIWRSRRYEMAYFANVEHVGAATGEHDAVLDALAAGDLDAACDALAANLTSAVEPLERWLTDRETST